jgi:hypothetical protein
MNHQIQPVETGNQTNDAVNSSLEFGQVIDLHPVYAAMAQAREPKLMVPSQPMLSGTRPGLIFRSITTITGTISLNETGRR